MPYVLKLANLKLDALNKDLALAKGLSVKNHPIVHPAVKEVFSDLIS